MITQYDDTEIQPVNSSMVHFRDGDGVFNFYMYDKVRIDVTPFPHEDDDER